MATTRRKKTTISFGFAGGRANLISSLVPDVGEQKAAEKAATASLLAAEQKATQARAREVARVFKAYQEGDATFAATIAALKASAGAESDAELRAIIGDYVRDTENTKLTRDVNKDIEDFNAGRSTYAQLSVALDKHKTGNEAITGHIQKSLDGARKAENAREISRLGSDYAAGRLGINQYTSAMSALRQAPNQKDPAELNRIDAAIDLAVDNERDLNDRMTYNQWQSGEISADAALAYFNARIATAKAPKDQASVSALITNIKKYQQDILVKEKGRGNASVGSSLKAVDASADADLKDFYEKVLKPGVEAAAGDPDMVMALYREYGELASGWASTGGTKAAFYAKQAERSYETGRLVAANEVSKRILADTAKLQAGIAADRANKTITPKSLIARLVSMAEKSAEGEDGGAFGAWTTDSQKSMFYDKRLEAWREINAEAETLLRAKDDAQSNSVQALTAAYSDASRALKKDKDGALTKALRAAGVLSTERRFTNENGVEEVDNKGPEVLDKNKFADWMQENPENNGLLVFESANKRKDDKFSAEYENGRTKYTESVVTPLTSAAAALADAREALIQAGYVKSPSARGNKPGNDNLDGTIALNPQGPFDWAAALPLDLPSEYLSQFDISETPAEQDQTRRETMIATRQDAGLAASYPDGGTAGLQSAFDEVMKRRYIGPTAAELNQRDQAADRALGPAAQSWNAPLPTTAYLRGESSLSDVVTPTPTFDASSWVLPEAPAYVPPPTSYLRGEATPFQDVTPTFDWELPEEEAWTPPDTTAGDILR